MNGSTRIVSLVSAALYCAVGFVALVMAAKSLLGQRFVRFQEEAAQTPWESINPPLRRVILAVMRGAGLGWLVVGLMMTASPLWGLAVSTTRVPVIVYGVPAVGLIYCGGLFVVTYGLHRATGVATPWKGSLIAAAATVCGLILTVLS